MPHQIVDPRNRRLGKVMRRRLTPAEFALWRKLQNRSLMGLRFRRQAPLGAYIVDFFCPEAKLAIEVDGGQHVRHANVIDDAARDAWLTSHGVRVVRFTNQEILPDVNLVCEAIVAAAALPER